MSSNKVQRVGTSGAVGGVNIHRKKKRRERKKEKKVFKSKGKKESLPKKRKEGEKYV